VAQNRVFDRQVTPVGDAPTGSVEGQKQVDRDGR
jgi:hypothetical protein